MRTSVFIVVLLSIGAAMLPAQSYRSTVNEGNEYYNRQEYERAREKYEQASVEEPDRMESYFNRGNAAYRAEDIKAALESYEKAGTRINDKQQLATTFYNAGNTFLQAADKGMENPLLQQASGGQGGDMRMQGYLQAIEMYKRTLKLRPADADARYNLTYAKKKLEEMQQQQQNEDQKKDQKQDKNEDQEQKDKSKDEQEQKKDQQQQDQQQQQNQKDQEQKEDAKKNEQQQAKPEEQKMSKQQAEQILRALEREEKALQKEKRAKVNARSNVEKDW